MSVGLAPFDLAQITRESLDLPPGPAPPSRPGARSGSSPPSACAGSASFPPSRALAPRTAGRGRPGRDGPQRLAPRPRLPHRGDGRAARPEGRERRGLHRRAGRAPAVALRRGRPRRPGRPPRRLVAPSPSSLCAVPSTVQFVVRKAEAPARPPPGPDGARRRGPARRGARPGDVVLQRPGARYPPAPVLLANLRVPYERYTPFRTQFASEGGPRAPPRAGVSLLPDRGPGRGPGHRPELGAHLRGPVRSRPRAVRPERACSSRVYEERTHGSTGSSRPGPPRRLAPLQQVDLPRGRASSGARSASGRGGRCGPIARSR